MPLLSIISTGGAFPMPIWLPWVLLAAAEAFKVWVAEQRKH